MYDFISDVHEYRNFRTEISKDTQNLLNIVDKSRTSSFAWKGQFSPQLIEFLLEEFPCIQSVLDPFCGSGTVIYEAILHKKAKISGVDINPAAVILANFSQYCMLTLLERNLLFTQTVKTIISSIEFNLTTDELIDVSILKDFQMNHLAQCILLNAFKDKKEVNSAKIFKSISYIEKRLLQLPYFKEVDLKVQEGDARLLPFNNNDFDLIITSPPYINVFNYHHNYRKAIEALNKFPLIIAKSEIGANRKYRSNRFKIVIQYCIDMALSLYEMHRVTRFEKDIILIVGNLSTVKGQIFYNGEIIYLISKMLGCFTFYKKLERQFLNRYGNNIKEEIMYFKNKDFLILERQYIINIGKAVANFILTSTLINISDQHSNYYEVKEAIDSIEDILPGDFIKQT